MKAPSVRPVRCAIYTRVSTEHGLDQEFNSLDAQYIYCAIAFILARSNTKTRPCPASSRRSWIVRYLMRSSKTGKRIGRFASSSIDATGTLGTVSMPSAVQNCTDALRDQRQRTAPKKENDARRLGLPTQALGAGT